MNNLNMCVYIYLKLVIQEVMLGRYELECEFKKKKKKMVVGKSVQQCYCYETWSQGRCDKIMFKVNKV